MGRDQPPPSKVVDREFNVADILCEAATAEQPRTSPDDGGRAASSVASTSAVAPSTRRSASALAESATGGSVAAEADEEQFPSMTVAEVHLLVHLLIIGNQAPVASGRPSATRMASKELVYHVWSAASQRSARGAALKLFRQF